MVKQRIHHILGMSLAAGLFFGFVFDQPRASSPLQISPPLVRRGTRAWPPPIQQATIPLQLPAPTDTADYAEVLRRIAIKIDALGRTYPHLAKFSIEKNVSGLQPGSEQLGIKYANGVRQVPNPRYRTDKKVSKLVPVYSKSDGIELILNLMTEQETNVQRVVFRETMIGNRVVDLMIEGKKTIALKEIREKIRGIIKDEKADYESKHAR